MEGEMLVGLGDRNKSTLDFWMPTWVRNLMENYQVLKREAKIHDTKMEQGYGTYGNISVNSLPRHPLVPALVCASGASLDDVLPYVKDFPGAIFCGASNLKTFAAFGREPEYMIALDSNADTVVQVKEDGVEWKNTTLITHPAIDPGLLKIWKWKRKFFRPVQLKNEFFERTIPMMYPFVEVSLLNAGCTLNTELEMANFLGYSPIILAGVDFGFVDGRRRCSQWKRNVAEERWERVPDGPIMTRYSLRISTNGCPTTEEMIAYKQNLMLVGRTDSTNIYTCSRGIIAPEETLGFVEPSQICEFAKNPPKHVGQEEMEKHYDKVLAKMGIMLEEDTAGTLRVASNKKTVVAQPKSTITFISKKGTSNLEIPGVLGSAKPLVVEKSRVTMHSKDDGKTVEVKEKT